MVQQVLADDGGTRTVEVHGRDIGGIVRDEEVPVHARQHAQEHRALDSEAVGERHHRDHYRALRVDEHAHREERECDGPRVMLHDVLEAALHHVHVVREVGVGKPRDSVDGDDCHHAALPHGARHSLLGVRLAEYNHERCRRNHHDLDDDVHGERLDFCDAVDYFTGWELGADIVSSNLQYREQHDDGEGSDKDIHGTLRFLGDFLVEHGGGVPVHVFLHLRVLETCLECGILVEVEPAPVRDECGRHEPADACGNRNRDNLQVVDIESVLVRDDDERGDGRGDGRTCNADLRSDRSYGARAFWADSLLERDVADNRHQGVHDVAGTHEHREEERAERCENSDVVRVLSQEPLRNLDEPIHAARCLHDACAGHRRDDDVDDVGRGLARLHAEPEHENREADSGNRAEGETPVAGTHVKREKYD